MRQYVYFYLGSDVLTAAEIAKRLDLEPDKSAVPGSRRTDSSPVPASHSWSIHSRNQDQRLDDQISEVLARIQPVGSIVRELVRTTDTLAYLRIVRYFNVQDGIEENLDDISGAGQRVLEHVGGQHQMLGWYLTPNQIELLAHLGAGIDADEYG